MINNNIMNKLILVLLSLLSLQLTTCSGMNTVTITGYSPVDNSTYCLLNISSADLDIANLTFSDDM